MYQLKITLEDVKPKVWRRLLVPGAISLGELHNIFQVAMGWTDSHLHSFTIGDELYGTQYDDYPEEELDENETTVQDAIGEARRFSYEYDFGDSWGHEVVVEASVTAVDPLFSAVCLDGRNAAPPEDCGGSHGYAMLLEALADPAHEDHDQLRQWAGEVEPTAFDLVAVNVELQQLL